MMTLRQRLEAIREIALGAPDSDHRACDIYQHAVEARTILDAGKRTFGKYEGVIVPDPKEPQ